jgi:hypothetical protein
VRVVDWRAAGGESASPNLKQGKALDLMPRQYEPAGAWSPPDSERHTSGKPQAYHTLTNSATRVPQTQYCGPHTRVLTMLFACLENVFDEPYAQITFVGPVVEIL